MAARFRDYELVPGLPPQDYYDEIKDLLLEADSVEVIRYQGSKLFFRAWYGRRKDGSMAVGADPNKEY